MAVKKEMVETVAVVGLAAVLASALFMGRLSVIGLFRSSSSHSATRSVDSEPAEVAPTTAMPIKTPSNASNYTASVLRDPLESFLPHPSTSLEATPSPAGTTGIAANPIAPATPREPPQSSLNIQGLIWGGPRPQAIISNRVYNVGDVLNGGTIASISRLGVALNYHGTMVFFSRASSSKGREGQQLSQGGGDGPR